MRRGLIPAILLAAILLLPGEAAAVGCTGSLVCVSDSRPDVRDFGEAPSQTFSFVFNPNYFNAEGGQNNSIRYVKLSAHYNVQEVDNGFLTATIGGTWLGNLFSVPAQQGREYRTSILWNNTAWINLTTTFSPGKGWAGSNGGQTVSTSTFAWDICNSVTYTSPNGTFYGAAKPCTRNSWGGNPNQIRHDIKFGNFSISGLNRTTLLIGFGNEETGDQTLDANDIGIPNVTAAYPTSITSVSGGFLDVGGDNAHHTLDYTIPTEENVAQVEGNEIGTSCESFGCLATAAITNVFGYVNNILTGVFGFALAAGSDGNTKVAQDASKYATQGLGILIGVPIEAIVLVFSSPGRSVMYLTWYLTLLGIVRYASSANAEFAVIYETPWRFWRAIAIAIKNSFVWLWDLSLRGFQALIDANWITLLIFAAIVLVTFLVGLFAVVNKFHFP